jgi:hypothetical protein
VPSSTSKSSGPVCWTGGAATTPSRISLNLVLLAGGWAAFAVLGDSWWQLPADPPVLVQPLTGLPTRPPDCWELRALGG